MGAWTNGRPRPRPPARGVFSSGLLAAYGYPARQEPPRRTLVHRQRALEAVVMAPGTWSGKRVFLTGHTGFKGSWLSLWLQQLGAEVFGYALPPPTTPSLFEIAQVEKGMQSL